MNFSSRRFLSSLLLSSLRPVPGLDLQERRRFGRRRFPDSIMSLRFRHGKHAFSAWRFSNEPSGKRSEASCSFLQKRTKKLLFGWDVLAQEQPEKKKFLLLFTKSSAS
jgi:hypothetical protein